MNSNPERDTAARGCLVYVMGPSGAGKDTVIAGARQRIEAMEQEEKRGLTRHLYFARRHVTRPDAADREIPLTIEDFAHYKRNGLFAFDWQAHGNFYGVSRIIDGHLAAGKTVVVSGSRAWLPQAQARYPALLAVLITVPIPIARQRLQARARETAVQIEERLNRNTGVDNDSAWLVTIDNSGPLEHAVTAFTDLLLNDYVCAID